MALVVKALMLDRLQTRSTWVLTSRTALFAAVVPEPRIRYVVAIWIEGNVQQSLDLKFEKLKEDGTYEEKWSPIPVAPSNFIQIPEGSYSVEDPVVTFEGGTNFYGKVGGAEGVSINVTVNYWDSEIF